jgi:hypothetical protein
LGNEAAQQLRQLAADQRKGFFSGKDQLDPGDLSLECLRMVYRLLFMFYIEARPELGYVPIGKSEVYLKGYSLESLRELEMKKPPARRRTRRGRIQSMRFMRKETVWIGGRMRWGVLTDDDGVRSGGVRLRP